MALDTAADQKTFRWDDPLDLTSRLSEDERMIWEAARSYARDKLLPRVVSAFAEERFDREIMTEMGALGFLGPTLPEEYGCAGVNHVAYGLIAREIEAIDSGLPLGHERAVLAGHVSDLRLRLGGAAQEVPARHGDR